VILIFAIPAGLTYTFGRMVGDTRQGWAIFGAMAAMFLVGVFVCYGYEQAGNPSWPNSASKAPPPPGKPAATWREGNPLRHRVVGLVRHRNHRCELRRRQQLS